ncbi:MAG: FtsW/RodA/SpoVE family cell cycle protein [Muribaculum sp.]|nr:FtsW/RodA/SpoVE family cell cycle protein [Muribaculum sp.]
MNDNDSYMFGTAEATTAGAAATASAPSAAQPAASAIPYKRHGDKSIWGIFIMLCLVSVIELYSASSREVASAGVYGPILRHCIMLGVGVAIVWTLEKVHYKWFFGLTWILAGLSLLAMIYVSAFGEIVNGARRSVSLFGITLQPSEFIKMSAVLVVARIMARSQKKTIGVNNSGIIWSALWVLAFGAVLFKQGLTNTILLMMISGAMMILGGTEWKKLLVVGLVYSVIAGGAFLLKDAFSDKSVKEATAVTALTNAPEDVANQRHHTWEARVNRYLSSTPKYEEPITATNRQEQYSYMAQANGGLIGVFPGNSRETARLPLAFSDYIFAIILEDTGFIGGLFLLILYLALLARAGVIARKCHRAFPVLLVIGMAVMIVLQALFHMAITTGAFPVSGQPLPLISKGGTSILVTSIAFGAMLSVSRTAVQNGSKQAVKEELSELPEDLRANNPVQF